MAKGQPSSLPGSELIPWSDGTSLKLFPDGTDKSRVEAELAIALTLNACNCRAPKCFGMELHGGRWALIYETCPGLSLQSSIDRQPCKVSYHGRLLARVHFELHCTRVPGLPELATRLGADLPRAPGLSIRQKNRLMTTVDRLDPGTQLCHGRLHPGTILGVDDALTLVDWDRAFTGPPPADAALTWLRLRLPQSPDGRDWIAAGLRNALRASLGKVYLQHYLELSGVDGSRVRAWVPVMAASLLEESPPAQRNWLEHAVSGGSWFDRIWPA